MRNLLFACIAIIVLMSVFSCDEWNSPETIDIEGQAARDLYTKRDSAKWAEEDKRHEENEAAYQEYLKNLLEYKKSDHPIMFGWFNAWQPDAAGEYPKLSLIPDSVDVVSIWGNWHSLTAEKIKELRTVQSKGTKVIIGWIVENIGDQIKWGRENWPKDNKEAIVEYAKAIVDTISKYGYDGFDYDYEPSYLSPFRPGSYQCGDLTSCSQNSGKENELLFMKTMRELLGPNRLFHLNGSITWLDPSAAKYFDRFVVQSYGGNTSDMDGWIKAIQARLDIDTKQLIFCDSYEKSVDAGRKYLATTYAKWLMAKDFKLGGIGAFHINQDALDNGNYHNVRHAISIMNPTVNK